MPAPIAKGIIIGATIIVAAGLALYENPHVRQWVDQSRRKIAIALGTHDGSSDRGSLNSEHVHGGANADEEWRKNQEQMIRRRRSEMIRKAREEGVAVDLDELSSIGRVKTEVTVRPPARKGSSFDDLVGADGKLKVEEQKEKATTSSADVGRVDSVRQRARQVSPFANRSADDSAVDLLDEQLIGATQDDISRTATPQPMHSPPQLLSGGVLSDPTHQSSESPRTLSAQPSTVASPAESVTVDQSFHSFVSPSPVHSRTSSFASPGTLTPTSDDDGFSTAASVVGTQASDIAVMSPSLHSVQDDDAMSEDAFSVIGGGQSTPGSWTDVGSDSGSEFQFNQNP